MTATNTETTVKQLDYTTAQSEMGDTLRIERFNVQRPGRAAHVVRVEVSWDSGTPQHERCDCQGYKYRQTCCHIDAVYTSGLLVCDCGA